MEQSVVGLVILVVVATLLLVGVPAWFIWALRNWAWPKGNRVEGSFRGVKATIIFSDIAREEMGLGESEAVRLAKDCACAAWAAREAWNDLGIDPTYDPTNRLAHVVVQLLTDEEFFGRGKVPDEGVRAPAAHLVKVGKRVGGDYLPMASVRTKFKPTITTTGSPVIHELCHQMVWEAKNDGVPSYDYMHADERIWFKPESVQGVARQMYAEEGAKG